MAKDRYEISLWEDVLQAALGQVPAHYEEEKICVIGSDTMTSPCRAYEPQLVQNINGTNTLTFKMYYVYTEPFNETEKLKNPFISLLVNERKVKALWKNKWYDFVIKGIDENSVDKSITYTCIDQYINELSKTGFELEFDNELENNQGTVEELGAKVLEGSDWQIGNGDTIQQKIEEPVQEVILDNALSGCINQTTGSGTSVTIAKSKKILLFYNQLQSILHSNTSGTASLQFLYADSYQTDTNKQLVINGDCYQVENLTYTYSNSTYTFYKGSTKVFSLSENVYVSNNYRAERLVESQESVFDPTVNKWVLKYTKTVGNAPHEIHGYVTTEYRDATFVNNLVVNSSNFSNVNGWSRTDGSNQVLKWQLYPDIEHAGADENYKPISYLYVNGASPSFTIRNSGIKESTVYLPNGCTKDEVYVLRVRLRAVTTDSSGNKIPDLSSYVQDPDKIGWSVKFYTSSTDETGTSYFSRIANEDDYDYETNQIICKQKCSQTFTKADILNAYAAYFGLQLFGTEYYIEEVQFFPEAFANDGTLIYPGDMDKRPLVYECYNYYDYTLYHSTPIDEIPFLYRGPEEEPASLNLQRVINDNFVKIRSITAKNSNRFNLLQTLAETFGCWCKFEIEHTSTGQINYVNGEPQKWVYFVNNVGQETGLSFTYGIDLKGITRNIQSDSIVTKTIVSPNSNEFGKNGFCTIARSDENYSKENFILDFGYYISHGLIDGNELNRDLQGNVPGSGLNYFFTLHNLNIQYDTNIELLSARRTELTKQLSYQKTYQEYVSAAQEQIQNVKSELYRYTSANNWQGVKNYYTNHPDDQFIENHLNALSTANENLGKYNGLLTRINSAINMLTTVIGNFETEQESLLEQIKAKHTEFNKKYSRFLQEGSWIDESYMDDNLYYLDAKSVAYTSSRPQVSQNISVARVSSLPEFQNRKFELGDIGQVQDIEFFGYTDSTKTTPYKEQILISEVTSYFDSPELDSFKVQNYKTQFEDLFQRITAATQSLQYSSGEYAKVATIINEDGTIKTTTLQNSIALNNELVFSSQNNTILQDNTGITIVDTTSPNFQVKLNAQGIFITTDGGLTWKNAVRGEGIATQYLTAGSIATNNVTIYDGQYPTFKWDSKGITAYEQITSSQEDPNPSSYANLNKYVRFDHFGVYGIEGNSEFIAGDEDDIWNTAKFGMTWRGFFVKNPYDDHYVEVSSENDIQVVDTSGNAEIVRVKIGELENDNYGFRINNASGAAVLEAGSDGLLWLKKELNISSTSGSGQNIKLGYLDAVKAIGSSIHETFNVNNNFIVYEDGSMKATDGDFSGTIHADGGEFTGVVYATDGQFTGSVQANAGVIGPFTISDNGASIIVQDAGLKFDDSGLSIIDSGLTILKTTYINTNDVIPFENKKYYQKDENNNYVLFVGDNFSEGVQQYEQILEPVLSQDPNSGELEVSGTIFATGGQFNGSIYANNGIIGGFAITEQELYSLDEGNTTQDANGAAIRLCGEDGKIVANNIELGTGAVIDDYIKLGDAYLYNPSKHGGIVLQAGGINNISLTQSGVLNLGNITVDGASSRIYGGENTNGYFSITPEVAVFNNVNVKGKISTAVFEANKMQAVGGLMLFKPSYKVSSQERNDNNNEILLNLEDSGLADLKLYMSETLIDYYALLFTGNDNININNTNFVRGIVKIENEQCKFIPFDEFSSEDDLESFLQNLVGLIFLGAKGDCYIGVNSGDNDTAFLQPRGITIGEIETQPVGQTDQVATTGGIPKTFLGDFEKASGLPPVLPRQGYGLYSDNVYLNGSLTTIVNNNSYAGVNTIDGAIFNKSETDTGRIVFWAGSIGTEDIQIQEAPFQVTENGTIYAVQGIFSDSLFANSIISSSEIRGTTIYGADIYTARIHGGSFDNDSPESRGYGINFTNTNNGIIFTQTDNDIITTKLKIDAAALYFENDKKFASYESNSIILRTDNLNLSGNIISSTNNSLILNSTNIINNGNSYVNNDFSIGDMGSGSYSMRYVQKKQNSVIIGQDLYVT